MRAPSLSARCAAFVLAGAAAASVLGACATRATPSPTSSLASPGGAHERGIFVEDLDRSVAPCDDFYAFANGSWRAANPIPPAMTRWSRRWQSGDANAGRLRDILDEISAASHPSGGATQLAGDYYAACMDEARVEADGAAPLAPLLAQIDAVTNARDADGALRTLHAAGVGAAFGLVSMPDPHDPSSTIANVAAGGLGLPDRDYYLKPEPRFVTARAEYAAYVARLLTLAGRARTPTEAAQMAAAVFELEKRLALASLDNVARRSPRSTDHPMTFAELQALTPRLDWDAYFTEAGLARARLNVEEPAFLRALEHELDVAPIADVRAYLTFHLLDAAAPFSTRAMVEASFTFHGKELSGLTEMKPRWKRCAESTDELLGDALGKAYVDRYFPAAARARVQALVRNVLAAMKETVLELNWMSPPTKQRALEKLATFTPKIGYPDTWKDYAGLRVRRDALWGDVVAARRFNVADDRARVGHPTDRARWGMTAPTSDASYDPMLNEITFPAGILQPPVFDLNADDPVNYGAIGVIIGHEISHGFDDEGAQFDAQGRLQNWWTDADLAAFQARGACVARQFDGYFVEPGIHHDGHLVLGESIGDLAGARIAFRALRTLLRSHPEPARDGFTPEQQFFIAWGQFRGDATRAETARLMVQGDPHPVAKFRVLGPLSNLEEFKAAFQCPDGAPMVRPAEARCTVW